MSLKEHQRIMWDITEKNPVFSNNARFQEGFKYEKEWIDLLTLSSRISARARGQEQQRARTARRGRQWNTIRRAPKDSTAARRHNHTRQRTHLYPWTSWRGQRSQTVGFRFIFIQLVNLSAPMLQDKMLLTKDRLWQQLVLLSMVIPKPEYSKPMIPLYL